MLLCAAVIAAGGGAGGCAFRSPAAQGRGAIDVEHGGGVEPVRWPERSAFGLDAAIAGGTQRLVSTWTPEVGVAEPGAAATIATVRGTKAYGRGVVRELAPAGDSPAMARLVPTAQFMSFRSPEHARAALADRMVWRTSFSSTRLEYFDPLPATEDGPVPEPRGLVVHLGSLGGRTYEMPVLEQFRRRGWAVVRLNASTAWERERPVRIEDVTDLDGPAKRLAAMIDDRLAEIAYAAEAAVAWIEDTRPHVPTRRVVVVGFSAGAISAPAVVVRLGDRVRAVVLVGAGANVLDISQSSSLTNGGIRVEWPDGGRDAAAWESLKAEYLLRSSLDPYTLGPRLADVPTLMLQGLLDDIVPTRTGELMYERLERPERWELPLGHKGLFWRLPAYAREISVWANRAAGMESVRTGSRRDDPPIDVR